MIMFWANYEEKRVRERKQLGYLWVVEAAQLQQRVQVNVGEVADGVQTHFPHRLNLVRAKVHAGLQRQSLSFRRHVRHEKALQHGQRAVWSHVELARGVIIIHQIVHARVGIAVRVICVRGEVSAPELRGIVQTPRPQIVQEDSVMVAAVQIQGANFAVRGDCTKRIIEK